MPKKPSPRAVPAAAVGTATVFTPDTAIGGDGELKTKDAVEIEAKAATGKVVSPRPRVLPFFEFSHRLQAVSLADKENHVIVRCALLNTLIGDGRVIAVFNDWSRHTRIGELAQEAAGMLDEIAHTLRLQTRGQLFEAGAGDTEINHAGLKMIWRHLETIQKRFNQFKGKSLPEILLNCTYRELGLPWPFVPFELQIWYWYRITGHITGQEFEFFVHADSPLIPPGLRTQIDEARTQSRDDDGNLWERLKQILAPPPPLPDGRRPKHRRAHLEEYARWFYRRRGYKDSVRSIALEYGKARHPDKKSDDRSTIMYGLKEAERLLNLAATLPL